MPKKIKVLVTGVGSGTGQAILTALKQLEHTVEIHACDFDSDAAGLYLVENRHILPKLESEPGILSLIKLINSENLQMIFPGNEFDVLALSRNKVRLEQSSSSLIMVSEIDTLQLTFDKWKTYNLIESHGIQTPQTFLASEIESLDDVQSRMSFPWVIKPRIGTAARNISFVRSLSEAEMAIRETPGALIQENLESITLLNGKKFEFTCGLFKDKLGNTHGPIVAQRILRNGTSWIVGVVNDQEVSEYVMKVASCFGFKGPMNVQLVKTDKGPKLLEVNCRFSGTSGIRALFGFNEAQMSIESFLFEREIGPIEIRQGKVLRYVENIVLT